MGRAAQQFALQIDAEYLEVVEGGILRALQVLALEAHELIQGATPVDTGAAAASWNISVGQPLYAIVGNTMAVLSMTKPDLVYITNAMEYISVLENGSSQQAPEGMVAVSLHYLELKYKVIG